MVISPILWALVSNTLHISTAQAMQPDDAPNTSVMSLTAQRIAQPLPTGRQVHKLDKLVRPQQDEGLNNQGPVHPSASATNKNSGVATVPRLTPIDPDNPATLELGDVFGLVTRAKSKKVDGETVVIYKDGTLGIKEPNSPGYIFQGMYLEDYNLLLTPEPLATVKLNDQNVFMVNDSLYNPAPMFSVSNWTLETRTGSTVVCPSWNSVLVHVGLQERAPCKDAVPVRLGVAALPLP